MTTKAVERQRLNVSPLAWGVLLIVALGGVGAAWWTQLSQGMQVTGLSRQVVWGLYIAGFFTAMGAGAGLLALAGLGEFLPQISVRQRRASLLLALVSFVVSALLIAMDLGNPVNLLQVLTAGRFSSMMTFDFWALLVAGVIALVYLIVVWKSKGSTAATRSLGVLALISSVALVVVEGWMLATLSAHPMWGALTVVGFLAAALVAGLALAMLVWRKGTENLVPWMAVALTVSLVVVLAEVFTGLVSGDPRAAAEAQLLVTGGLSWLFWLQVIVGLLVPLGILALSKNPVWLSVAAGLAFLGVIAEKLWLLVAGQTFPWISIPSGTYAPTWVEYLGLLGAIGLAALLYLAVGKLAHMDEV